MSEEGYNLRWQVALRRAMSMSVCTDEECDLSGERHAVWECPKNWPKMTIASLMIYDKVVFGGWAMVNEFGHTKRSRSPRREQRRAIKRAILFQGVDALERRRSFLADMCGRGLGAYGMAVETHGHKGAAKVCVPFRLVTLVSDPAVRYLPATGAP